MTIEMYQDVMNHLQIDKYRELIIEQDQKITELEKACEETQELLDKQIEATYRLDKENAELKEINTHTLSQLNLENGELITELTKSKELLERFLNVGDLWELDGNAFLRLQSDVTQFLKDSEGEK